jgi:hypothetical protein
MPDPIAWSQFTANERDALVAEHIFKRKIVKWKDGRVLLMAREGKAGHESIPAYSASMDAAWLIAECFDEIIVYKYIGGKCQCELSRSTTWYKNEADTPQEAICLAALKACGIEIEVWND